MCKKDDKDQKPYDTIHYCNDQRDPIVCYKDKHITRDDSGNVICDEQCEPNYLRVPGSPSYSSLCSIHCTEHGDCSSPFTNVMLNNYKHYYKCSNTYNTLGYQCFHKGEDDENSGFFFSRCYNQPNFYGVISTENKKRFDNGYFYEFWFKLDKVQILEHCNTDDTKEYILYSTPHSIYLDLKENQYYYQIIDSVYSSKIDGINDYEWNKIVIKTTLGSSLGQNVYVYINFDIDNIKATIKNIPSSIKMQLQYISFCSK